MQISTVGKNFCFSFVVSTHICARKVTEPTHQHVVRVELWRRQHILIGCCCLTKHKLRQRNRISNTRKHFLCLKWNYPWTTFANAIYSAGARVISWHQPLPSSAGRATLQVQFSSSPPECCLSALRHTNKKPCNNINYTCSRQTSWFISQQIAS